MKWMFKLVMLAATLWSGYWYIGKQAQEKMYVTLLKESRAAGWTVESRNLGVVGFPSRFDTTLTDLNLQGPSGRWGWQGEEFLIKSLSYQPNHIIAAWPGEHILNTPAGSISFSSELLRASIVVSPAVNVPLERLQLEGENIALQIPELGAANIESLNAAVFQKVSEPTHYMLGIDLVNITPPSRLTSVIGGGASMPDLIRKIYVSGELAFDRELDRNAYVQGAPPRPISLQLGASTIHWGSSMLDIKGELRAGAGGYIEGYLDFDVQNWQPLFEIFKQLSNLSATEKLTVKQALESVSGGGSLEFTLRFTDGETSIGPFAIGPAPRNPF